MPENCRQPSAAGMMDLQSLLQALTDPENQPHQWVGDKEALRELLSQAGPDLLRKCDLLLNAVVNKGGDDPLPPAQMNAIEDVATGLKSLARENTDLKNRLYQIACIAAERTKMPKYESTILCPDSDIGYRVLHELVQDGWEPIFHWQGKNGSNHIVLRRRA